VRVAIHQANYFPWMGYFNKIAKSDAFILMDDVHMSDGDMAQRNRLLNKNGEIAFITTAFEKKGYLQKHIRDIKLNENIDWQKRQMNFLWDTYHKFPAWKEVYMAIEPIFADHYDNIFELNERAIYIIYDLLEIKTPIILQSSLDYNKECLKSDLVLELCKAAKADVYLSGNGARKYMEIGTFQKNGIEVQYQTFKHPAYEQKLAKDEPVLGLSILDVLLNCGIDETKKLFWNNLQENEKNEEHIV
jgi:hypothetical protein